MLAGDALLAEAFRLACSYPTPDVARELAEATLGMIGGQYLDTMEPDDRSRDRAPAEDRAPLLRVGDAARSGRPSFPREEQAPWRASRDELGMLFQVVDDILDGDGYVLEEGAEAARDARRTRAAERALALLLEVPADTVGAGRDRRRASPSERA